MSHTFSVRICDKNPHRWYISFSLSKPFSMKNIKETLEQEGYSTLATTPNIMVFRGKDVKLTWHSQGLIQIDYYDKKIQNEQHIITFVQVIIDKFVFH
ncbi:MAG: hypothetical protein ACTSR4_05355 [Candidatus Hodarchaeales archaeon]